MKKRFLLIGYNFHPELTGIGKYSGEMVQWLANAGYECAVITAYPYYPHWRVQEPYRKSRFWYSTEEYRFASGGKITVYRCPMYVPSRPSGITRMLLDFSFLCSAFFQLLALLPRKRFQTVCAVAPSFQVGLLGVFYKKVRRASFLYHIQDLQIEAARELGLIRSPLALNALFAIEKYILSTADIVSSISEGMMQRIAQKARKPVSYFPNWTDTQQFYPIANRAALKTEFGFGPNDKIVLYSGAIGEKQGLEAILQAAECFRQAGHVRFVICGSGPYKQKLEAAAHQAGLNNLTFFPLQPLERFNGFLNAADVHLVIQKSTASDLVMPSKLSTILAVGGLALITAPRDSGLCQLVHQHNMALAVEPDDQPALNAGIETALSLDATLIMRNARAYAEEHLSLNSVMHKFTRLIR